MSKVMADGKGRIKFPINEPAEGKRKSRSRSTSSSTAVRRAAHRPLHHRHRRHSARPARARRPFPDDPHQLLRGAPERIGEIDEDLADLSELGILADRDDEGYLLQIFTKPLSDRPTLFLEVIERHGARGFGEGNFKAFFEAIEREQERRGNL